MSLIERTLKAEGVSFSYDLTSGKKDATRLAKNAVREGNKIVAVVGGDGTIHEAANGMVDGKSTLGIIPLGTGNDIARYLGIPKDPVEACRVLINGREKIIDSVKIGDKRYIGVGGTGIDAEVTALANRTRKFPAVYIYCVFRTLFGYKPKEIHIQHEGGDYRGLITLVAAGNTSSYGNGMFITPNAQADDGLLDVCLAEGMGKISILRLFPKLFKGSHLGDKKVKSFRTSKMTLDSPSEMEFYADGELIGVLPLTLEIIPKSLRVMTPI